jgi:hypothetical protein
MDVTVATWFVAVLGILLITLLMSLQAIAVARPRAAWTVANVYGGSPDATDPKAYFAFNQGMAWADVFFWAPLQLAGSVGMVLGARWGFLLALVASVPYLYTAVTVFVWDRCLGFQRNTFFYWVVVWAMWPAFGLLQMTYCSARLLF